jgi:hypothetical protein
MEVSYMLRIVTTENMTPINNRRYGSLETMKYRGNEKLFHVFLPHYSSVKSYQWTWIFRSKITYLKLTP